MINVALFGFGRIGQMHAENLTKNKEIKLLYVYDKIDQLSSKAKKLYGSKEGQHATPSEIALTLHLEPSLLSKQIPLPDPAPSGPINGPEDFRLRHPDGRMGSDPYLALPDHGKILLEKAAFALSVDLSNFLDAL